VAAQWKSGDGELPCPVCEVPMLRGTVGPATLHECGRCFGLWLDTVTFERLCRDAEQQAAVLAASTTLGQPCVTNLEPVRYRRCPVCRDVMNRVNFARCSGVVVDACRTHGSWFDRDELHRIVEFIRAGGLGVAREKQMAAWAEESRRLESARREEVRDEWRGRRSPDLLSMVVGSSRGLLGRWIER
jgi:Zn-finger nucleic acid-binding protein